MSCSRPAKRVWCMWEEVILVVNMVDNHMVSILLSIGSPLPCLCPMNGIDTVSPCAGWKMFTAAANLTVRHPPGHPCNDASAFGGTDARGHRFVQRMLFPIIEATLLFSVAENNYNLCLTVPTCYSCSPSVEMGAGRNGEINGFFVA